MPGCFHLATRSQVPRALALAPLGRESGAQGLSKLAAAPLCWSRRKRALASQASGNPHDQYFKHSFGQPELAADLVAHYLPADMVQAIDLGSL